MRNRGKFSKLLWLLLIVAFAAIAGGGCGGGSSRGGGSGADVRDLMKTDSSGVPKLFSLPGTEVTDIAIMGPDGAIDVKAPMSVISSVGYVGSSGKEIDVDRYFAKGLKKGVTYTFEVTNNGMSPLQFTPMISLSRILNGRRPSDDADLEPLSYYASNIPAVDTAIIAGTFTAPEDGDYLIEVYDAYDIHALPALDPDPNDLSGYEGKSDDEYEVRPHLYLFRFYEERGTTPEMYGSPTEVYGDDGYALTPDDLVALRRALMSPSTKIGVMSKDGEETEINLFCWDRIEDPEDLDRLADRPDMYGDDLFDILKEIEMIPSDARSEDSCIPVFPIIKDDKAGIAATEAFNYVLDSLRGEGVNDGLGISAKGISAKGTRLESVISDVPFFRAGYRPGLGIDAATGELAQQEVLDTSALPKEEQPAMREHTTTSTAQYISTKEEYEKTQTSGTGLTINLGSIAIKAGNETQNSVKYGKLSTTLWLHFDMTSQRYEFIDTKDLKLSAKAQADIASGMSANDFRSRYGDYIPDGFCYAAQYDAFIAITTNSVEKLETIKKKLSVNVGRIVDRGNNINTDIDHTMNALRGTKIDITVKTIGSRNGWAPFAGFKGDGGSANGIASLFQNMRSFAESATSRRDFNYGIKYMSLRRINMLPGCDFIPEEIDMDTELFAKTREMSRARLELKAQYNAVMDIPAGNLRDRDRLVRGWTNRFSALNYETTGKLREICASATRVEEQTRKLNSLADEFSKISQRWSFYRSLMSEQQRERIEFLFSKNGPNEWRWGYENFPCSSLVNNSLYNNSRFRTERTGSGAPWEMFKRHYLEIDLSSRDTGDCHIAYIKIWSGSNGDEITRRNSHTIGNKSLHIYFKGGSWRAVDWKFYHRLIDINDTDLWPFAGL